MKQSFKKIKERGSILVMAIILSSGVLVVSIEVGLFVVSAIQQAKNIDQTIVAHYAAESAVENALEQVRKEGRTTLRTDSQDSPPLYKVDNRDARWTFKNGLSVDATKFSSTVDVLTKTAIAEQQAVDVHLYNADSSSLGQSAITMQVSWKASQCQQSGQNAADDVPWIETTGLAWNVAGTTITWDNNALVKKDFQTPQTGMQFVNIDLQKLFAPNNLGTQGVTLRIKPFYCSLKNVSIAFYKTSDQTQLNTANLMAIPNYYLIKPTGSFGGVKKDIRVLVPQKGGASGIFDFVLFSDETVNKSDQ